MLIKYWTATQSRLTSKVSVVSHVAMTDDGVIYTAH